MKYRSTLLLLFCTLLFFQCKKDKSTPKGVIVVSTIETSNITNNTALSGGTVLLPAGQTFKSRGVCWGTSNIPTINDSKTTDSTNTNVFSSTITGLTANTTYYVRAYAVLADNTVSYGEVKSFVTTNTVIYYMDFTVDSSIQKHNAYQDSLHAVTKINAAYPTEYITTITATNGGNAPYTLNLILVTYGPPQARTYTAIPDTGGFIKELTYQYKNTNYPYNEDEYIATRFIPYSRSACGLSITSISSTSIKGAIGGYLVNYYTDSKSLSLSGDFYLPYSGQ